MMSYWLKRYMVSAYWCSVHVSDSIVLFSSDSSLLPSLPSISIPSSSCTSSPDCWSAGSLRLEIDSTAEMAIVDGRSSDHWISLIDMKRRLLLIYSHSFFHFPFNSLHWATSSFSFLSLFSLYFPKVSIVVYYWFYLGSWELNYRLNPSPLPFWVFFWKALLILSLV